MKQSKTLPPRPAPGASARSRVDQTTAHAKVSLRDVVLLELQVASLPRNHYRAGAVILAPDIEAQPACFCIVKGRVRLYWISPIGEEIYYDELGPGDCVKPILSSGEDHRPMFARTLIDTTVEILSETACTELMERSLPFNKALVRDLSRRIAYLDRRLYEATALPMKVRLQTELLRLAQRQSDGTLAIRPPPTHRDLAIKIGSQREAVSKELARLARDGMLRRTRTAIVLLQEDRYCDELKRTSPV